MDRAFTLTVYDIKTGDIEWSQTYPSLAQAQSAADFWDINDFEVSIESNLVRETA